MQIAENMTRITANDVFREVAMPIYEYFCSKCALEFELMRPFSESDKAAKCPKCRSIAQKLVSGFGSKTSSVV